MKFGSIYYIMSFSARTTNVCILYTCSTRGRMEAAGIYSEWWLLCENTLLPKQTKNAEPPSWVFTTDRKAYVSSGAFYFLKTRHRHAVVVVVFKAYVDNHVWRTLWWSFRISISGSATIFCCRMLAGPQFFFGREKNNSWLKLLISPLFLPKKFLFFNEISLTYSYNSKGALKEFWRKM